MAEVMRESNRFREIFVQLERASDVARDGGDFNGMREPRAEMIAAAVEEDLRLVFEPAKGARVNDTVAVALVLGAPFGGRFGIDAPARVGAELGVGSEILAFDLFEVLAGAGHGNKI